MTEYQSTTTLNRIREAGPCREGWEKLLAHLGKTKADDEPLQLMTVLDSNGLDDSLWVLSYAMPDDRLARHFQAWCAEQVLHIFEAERPNDMRVRDQIAMLRNDETTVAARAAAAQDAAWAAAWAAAQAARRAAARAAAGDAAWAAAWAAARDAARDAAWAAAGDAARAAAGDAAWAAAWDAARAAAWAAAWDAAQDAARAAQEKQLRKMLLA
jgi:hypothetical protein